MFFSPGWLSALSKAHHPPTGTIMICLQLTKPTSNFVEFFQERRGAYSKSHTVHNLLRVTLQDHSAGGSKDTAQQKLYTNTHFDKRRLSIQSFKTLHSYLPSVYNFIHSQEEPLHILQQSPPLDIFSTGQQKYTCRLSRQQKKICRWSFIEWIKWMNSCQNIPQHLTERIKQAI